MNPTHGYTNTLARHQTPKPSYEPAAKRTGPKPLTDKTGSKYEWNQCLRMNDEKFVGCGEINESLKCWCSECGWPADGPDQAACPRCGTTNEPRCR